MSDDEGRRGGRHFGYLTEVHPDDMEIVEVLGFIRRFGCGEVLSRTAEQLLEAAAYGWLLATRNLETDELVATGLIELPGGRFAELGSVVVHDNFRRFGLHPLLIDARLAKLAETVAFRFTPATVPTNDTSRSNVIAKGFQLMDPFPRELLGPCAQCQKPKPANKVCCSNAFELHPLEFRRRLREFLRLGERIELRRSDDGAKLSVQLCFPPAYDPKVRIRLERLASDPMQGRGKAS